MPACACCHETLTHCRHQPACLSQDSVVDVCCCAEQSYTLSLLSLLCALSASVCVCSHDSLTVTQTADSLMSERVKQVSQRAVNFGHQCCSRSSWPAHTVTVTVIHGLPRGRCRVGCMLLASFLFYCGTDSKSLGVMLTIHPLQQLPRLAASGSRPRRGTAGRSESEKHTCLLHHPHPPLTSRLVQSV